LQGPGFDPLWRAYREKRLQLSQEDIKAQEGDQEPLFAYLRAEELRREFPLILLTLKNLASGRLVLTPAGVSEEGRLVPSGFDITAEVETYLSS
jgi:hypothetical protein